MIMQLDRLPFPSVRLNGFQPYRVLNSDGVPSYLFELKESTSMRRICLIEKAFTFKHLLWFTRDEVLLASRSALDIVVGFERPLLFFRDGKFLCTKYRPNKNQDYAEIISITDREALTNLKRNRKWEPLPQR